VIGVSLDGENDILGLWAGTGGEGFVKFWIAVLTDIRNRGTGDVFFLVCDGLKGCPRWWERVAAGHGPDLHHPLPRYGGYGSPRLL
jgi:putative transposase